MTGGFINRLMENMTNQPTPEKGMGATINHYSDRKACTIIEVKKNGKEIVVQEDMTIRLDSNGMSDSQSYKYIENNRGCKHTARLTKKGWRLVYQTISGRGTTSNTPSLTIGIKNEYYDYTF